MVENIVRKGEFSGLPIENTVGKGKPAFSPLPAVFSKGFTYSVVKSHDCIVKSEPSTRRHILDSSKLKEFADDNFKFDENGRKLSKQVENTVGKGEIARYEQFLLFPQCFQKACFHGASKGVIVWDWVKKTVVVLWLDKFMSLPSIGETDNMCDF